ncbi:MAG: pyridoxamine 5'-phosphate oxidase family protein [Actinobacteria bacterium]|nr:pyridoxamine 5'-phosphate oxidase family protein [Actinomycetota bacterium]
MDETTVRRLVPTRLAERAEHDRAALDALLDEVLVAHVGLTLPEGPLVLPIGFARDGDRLLLHGSTGSRWLRVLAGGADACVTVTSLDALKVARSAFESGMRYRSACLFGRCAPLPADEASAALVLFTDRLLPGRSREIRPSTARELAATMVLAFPIDQWSLKSSDGFPEDPDDDRADDAWAGVVPLRTGFDAALPNPDLRPGIAVPASVRALTDR